MDKDLHFELILEAISKGYPQSIIARGHSMYPQIKDKSKITLYPIKKTLELDDIVAVLNNHGQLIIHRIIGMTASKSYLLKGDHQISPDGWFTKEQIFAIIYI